MESIKFSETYKIKFDLFVDNTSQKIIDIYIGDIPITCDAYGSRISCQILASVFHQNLRS